MYMYKEIIISIVVIVVVFTLDFSLQKYTKETIGEFSLELSNLEKNIRDETLSSLEIKDKTNQLYDKWLEHHEKLVYYIEHDELEKVESNFSAGKSFIESEKYSDAMSELEKTSFVLKHIEDKYAFNLENIF